MENKIKEIVSNFYKTEQIESIKVFNSKVIITLVGSELENADSEITVRVKSLDNVKKVSVVHTVSKNVSKPSPASFDDKWNVKGVKKIIGVASGKGGVGKSTTSVNIALALANQGMNVALFDADIYGPSIPTMLGYEGEPVRSFDGSTFEPFMHANIQSMSIGALIDRNTALIWRGSKAVGAIQQLITDTNWHDVDVMIIDMPPGTGDIQLSLSQKLDLNGIVIVSTPQDIALIDAVKGVNMFQKVGIPILGIVENMSYYICENCGTRAEIFGHEGAKETSEKLKVKFLGEIPLHIEIRETSDNGMPVVFSSPDSPHSIAYENIAKELLKELK
ncbi:MAG: Mrp/NBP35 family ATP-binding protein [Lactobacillaceae bacterium]|jgi:ATP-binding protein involved in chromosome partitioning|nr:Mrp/NBP35 family ATP-binding protein [Lactobacillaceae bacterium]